MKLRIRLPSFKNIAVAVVSSTAVLEHLFVSYSRKQQLQLEKQEQSIQFPPRNPELLEINEEAEKLE